MTKRGLGVMVSVALVMAACEAKEPAGAPETAGQPVAPAATTPAAEIATATTASTEEMLRESRKFGHVPIVGETTREAVVERFDNWKKAVAEAEVDAEAVEKLGSVPEGAKVTVVFGTWCSDCYRELPRLWKAMDETGLEAMPFEIEYVALDETFSAGKDISALGVHNIPTVIVERDGAEVGRIIESTPRQPETELAALLHGESRGVITNSPAIRERYGLGAP